MYKLTISKSLVGKNDDYLGPILKLHIVQFFLQWFELLSALQHQLMIEDIGCSLALLADIWMPCDLVQVDDSPNVDCEEIEEDEDSGKEKETKEETVGILVYTMIKTMNYAPLFFDFPAFQTRKPVQSRENLNFQWKDSITVKS